MTKDLTVWEATFWKIFSCACFAGINGVVRYLSSQHANLDPLSVHVIMFFQNLFGTLILLPFVLKPSALKTQQNTLHFFRVLTAVGGIAFWYLTLQAMPIAEGTALSFTGPIFTIIGAWLFLKERIGWRRLFAIALSLFGAFSISRPDLALKGQVSLGLSALFPLISALLLALSKLLTRQLAASGEKPLTLATYLLLLMTPVSLPLALYEWTTPNIEQLSWLLLLGILAALSHLSFSRAYQLAEVSFLAPLGLIKFLFGGLIGYIAFSEIPSTLTLWVGVSVIVISTLLLSNPKKSF